MRNVWLVMKHEIWNTIRKRSFWVLALLMPALLLVFQMYYFVQDTELGNGQGAAEEEESLAPRIALIDDGDLVRRIPAQFPQGLFVMFDSEKAALSELESGEIDQVVVISPDYVSSGEVTIYDENFRILGSASNPSVAFGGEYYWALQQLLTGILADNDTLFVALSNPTPAALAKIRPLNPPSEDRAQSEAQALIVSSIIPYIYYFILIIISGFILQSVTAEKENRTVEVLLLSLSPRELMLGKILGLSLIALLQLVIWVGGGVLISSRASGLINIPTLSFSLSFYALALLFLILGYLLFASIMAAAGAISPTAREAGQVTWLLVIPLIPTLMFGTLFAQDPQAPLVIILSLFPLSAPSAMVTRLAVGDVPAWHVILSIAGLSLTTALAVQLAARFFRPQNLLSGASFSWRRFVSAWR